MGLFSYLFASDNTRSLMKIEKIVKMIEDNADKYSSMSDEEKLDLLATDGMLVKRPILVTEKAVLVGFKESEWEGVVSGKS